MLALPIKPKAVLENLTHLEQIGARGSYGLYEAVDYTPRHLSLGEEYAVVREYMAHHQGMIMVALDNALNDEIMVERFHSDPLVRSYDLLLQEKIPTHTVLRYPETERSESAAPSTGYSATAPLWTVKGDTPHPYVHTLSNGRYSVIVTNTGGGYSQWADTGLTRFMPDAALDVWGNWVYLQDTSSGDYWSAGYAPTGRPGSSYTVHFFPHKVEFVRRDGDISLKMEVTVAPDDDVEIRRVVLTNHSAEARPLFLADYAEVILAPQETDQRHPAFNKLFIESEYLPEQQGLLFRRRPRASHEQPVFLFHGHVRRRHTVHRRACLRNRPQAVYWARPDRAHPAGFQRASGPAQRHGGQHARPDYGAGAARHAGAICHSAARIRHHCERHT
jgi:hypothetical protein